MTDSKRVKAARRKLRDPLEAGNPRRLTDARCAWRKMTRAQREEFIRWLLPAAQDGYSRLDVVQRTLSEWDGIHPPEAGGSA